MERRTFLKAALGASSSIFLHRLGEAAPSNVNEWLPNNGNNRFLKLYRPETHERLHIYYMRDGQWDNEAYKKLCWFMRDCHLPGMSGYVAINKKLFDLLWKKQQWLSRFGYNQDMVVFSGYRSLITNSHTEGAALLSEHMNGNAADVHIPGLPSRYLAELAAWFQAGGVGLYVHKNSVHVDTNGRIRRWQR